MRFGGDGNDGELEAISAPEQTTTNTVTNTTTVATAPQEPATFVADATLLTDEYSPVADGTYRVDTLGAPFTLTIGPDLWVQPNSLGQFVLTHASSQGPDDRDIVIVRLSRLSDPAQPGFGIENLGSVWPEDLGDGWPADDFAGWLDNLIEDVMISNRETTTLGGLAATRVDLELGETSCSGRGPCMLFGSSHGWNARFLNPGSNYRIWVLEVDSEDPMAVIVGINREADLDWFDTADTILSTLAFGDVGPNPIQKVTAGPIELPFLGGIRSELSDEALVFQRLETHGTIGLEAWWGDTDFLANPYDSDGNALETPDDLVSALEQSGTVVTEIESIVIDGLEARAFDIASSSNRPSLNRAADDERGWWTPARGRLWVIDHPERGLLMITSEAFASVDTIFPIILAHTESIIESLEFIDLE